MKIQWKPRMLGCFARETGGRFQKCIRWQDAGPLIEESCSLDICKPRESALDV